MRMLQANSLNEGRGNSNARMAEILDEESGYSELYEALEGLLKSGAHDGPCDNTDEDGAVIDEPCSLHLAAFERRHKQARAALQKALPKEEGGKA